MIVQLTPVVSRMEPMHNSDCWNDLFWSWRRLLDWNIIKIDNCSTWSMWWKHFAAWALKKWMRKVCREQIHWGCLTYRLSSISASNEDMVRFVRCMAYIAMDFGMCPALHQEMCVWLTDCGQRWSVRMSATNSDLFSYRFKDCNLKEKDHGTCQNQVSFCFYIVIESILLI